MARSPRTRLPGLFAPAAAAERWVADASEEAEARGKAPGRRGRGAPEARGSDVVGIIAGMHGHEQAHQFWRHWRSMTEGLVLR